MECAQNICAESRGEIAACSPRPLGSLIKGCFRELEIWLGMQKPNKTKNREKERERGKENNANRFTDVNLQGEQRIFKLFSPFIALTLHLFSVGLSLIEAIWGKCSYVWGLAGKIIAVELKSLDFFFSFWLAHGKFLTICEEKILNIIYAVILKFISENEMNIQTWGWK